MFTRNLSIALMTVAALILATTSPLHAELTKVVHQDFTTCDPLLIPPNVDEIGDILVFPPDEALEAVTTVSSLTVCPGDDPAMDNALVRITNFTGRDLTEVWYVANNETRISNVDGYANDLLFAASIITDNETFRIDSDFSDPGGTHHPLIAESGIPNDIWEAGETWEFILQDYGNALNIAADRIDSIGVGDASMALVGVVGSSGSIIAIPIPEPGSALLALFGCVGLTMLNRRRGAVSEVSRRES